MKVLSLLIVLVGYAAGLGSGPYLPSGWKPSGPAFYLPTEVEKTSPAPLQESVQEEASGSDFLREYGPPKVSQDITVQELPDVETEQPFVIQAKFNEDTESVAAVEEAVEAVTSEDNITEAEESVTTEATVTENINSEVSQGRSIDVETEVVSEIAEVSEVAEVNEVAEINEVAEVAKVNEVEEVVNEVAPKLVNEVALEVEAQQETENANSNIVTIQTEEVKSEVNNIAEALNNLENEKAQEVQTTQEVSVNVEQKSGSVEAPEGFLEYGPPGFKEYGPPKQTDDLRTAVVEDQSVDSNETRRRRYSPKFKTLVKRKH